MRRVPQVLAAVIGTSASLVAYVAVAATPVAATSPSTVVAQPYSSAADVGVRREVTPWTGTITTRWTLETDPCDGCIQDRRSDSGKLVYSVSGGDDYTFSTDSSSHRAAVTGSGSQSTRMLTDLSDDKCLITWTARNVATTSVRLGINQPIFYVPYVWVPATYREISGFEPCGFPENPTSVGGFPHSGIGNDPGDPDPNQLRLVPDRDPNPDRWRGSRTFSASPNGPNLRSYSFTIDIDLQRRADLRMATIRYPASTWPGATYEVRISVAGNTNLFGPWVSTGAQRSHVFKNLRLGGYVVEIRAVKRSGEKSPALRKAFRVTTKFPISK